MKFMLAPTPRLSGRERFPVVVFTPLFDRYTSYSGEITTIIRVIGWATFEVAAIKPSSPTNRDLRLRQTNGLFVATGYTLQRLARSTSG